MRTTRYEYINGVDFQRETFLKKAQIKCEYRRLVLTPNVLMKLSYEAFGYNKKGNVL